MTISNIVSGFKVTGVYPVDREALLGPFTPSPLPEETGLAYIPLYSPLIRRKRQKRTTSRSGPGDDMEASFDIRAEESDFSDQELALFEEWFVKGSDVTDNSRYSAWLGRYHSMSPAASHVCMQGMQSTGVSRFLSLPMPPPKLPTTKQKAFGRVLTSHENLTLLDEKRKAREMKEKEKEEKRLAREEKRRNKEKGIFDYHVIILLFL